MKSLLVTAKSFVATLLLWGLFAGGLLAGMGAGAVLDGTRENVATIAGSVVALVTGSRIARKPKIKSFLSKPGTLWFLFNGGAAVAMYLTMDGVKGILATAAMGLVPLGAAGGLVASRRKPTLV